MLRNRKYAKSYPKSIFAYQTNRSGDSFEKHEDYNSSSSSDSLSSDLVLGSSANSSTSSLTSSSDNSSEFNEVEKVIEEYFIRKLAKNSLTKSQNINISKSISDQNIPVDVSMGIAKDNDHQSLISVIEGINKESICSLFNNVGTQVSTPDLKRSEPEVQTKRFILRSWSLMNARDIWNPPKYFNGLSEKSTKDSELNFLFENSYTIFPRYSKTLRHTEILKHDNYIGIKNIFSTYFSRCQNPSLSLPINHFSPFKAILLLEQHSSKILLLNDKAKALFRLSDSQIPLCFDNFLVKKCKYANLLDIFSNINGNICFLPARMVICKDSFGYHFYASLRLQRINSTSGVQGDFSPILLIIEPLLIRYGLCTLNRDDIVSFDIGFVNILQLHNTKENVIFSERFSDILRSRCHSSYNISRRSSGKIVHNILKYANEDMPFYFLSLVNSVSKSEAFAYSKIYDMKISDVDYKGGDFNTHLFWFYSNLSCVLNVSAEGRFIDCDLYFRFLVGYEASELGTLTLSKILKFNLFEFEAVLNFEDCSGKYDATLTHLNGSKIKTLVSISKQENIDGTTLFSLWFTPDHDEQKLPNITPLQSLIQTEGPVNLKNLLYEFGGSKIDKALIKETEVEICDKVIVIEPNENFNKSKNSRNSSVQFRKKRYFSLPESKNKKDVKVSPWIIHTPIDIKDSNTSSETSGHSKEPSFIRDSDTFYEDYNISNIIGKGAFGFVRLATSKSSNEEFVVKFIKKSKLAIEHMVKAPVADVNSTERRSMLLNGYEAASENKIMKNNNGDKEETFILIPREIWMLCQLSHENIVSLYDWYEGVDHYQMVMPKHGVGMDLFEFIDRSPLLDEMLVSHIFRQLANAVEYLHNLMISHRDIKDENIILDDVFKIKLIDFGAAVKVEPDQKFKTFCGTMEFCSPEILLGQEYNCFHADIWSMGITLYTIMFGENPFYDFEETVSAILKPPKAISSDLLELLSMILEPNPLKRITAEKLCNHPWLHQRVDIGRYSFEDIVPNSDFSGNIASDFRKYSIDFNCERNKNIIRPTNSGEDSRH